MKELKKKINLNIDDFVIYEEITYFSSVSKILGMLFVLVLLILTYIGYRATGQGLLLLFVFGIPVVSYVYTAFSMIPQKAGSFYKTSPFLDFPPMFTLTEDSMSIERRSGVSELKLSQILSIIERFGYFFIYISKNNFIILPKRDLNKDEIVFVRKVMKSLPRKQRRSPHKMTPGKALTTALITILLTLAVWLLIFYIFPKG